MAKRIGSGDRFFYRQRARKKGADAGDLRRAVEEAEQHLMERRAGYRQGGWKGPKRLPKGKGKGKFCVEEKKPQFHWNTDAYLGTASKILHCFPKRRDALAAVRRLNAGEDRNDEHARSYKIVHPL